jgi:tRNA threonylcarbamoyladenosine biosynthesis protein TsaE
VYQTQVKVTQEFEVGAVSELEVVAQAVLKQSATFPIVLLHGEMGTGKTTLVKAIIAQCGGVAANSPTFSIVNQYDTPEGTCYHFDLYRLENMEELYDIGFEEYVESGKVCFIEWPDIAMDLITPPYQLVELSLGSDSQRHIKLSVVSSHRA